jgi:hypothetical protein
VRPRPRRSCRRASIGIRALGGYRVEELRLTEERVMFPLPGDLLAVASERWRRRAPRQRARRRARGDRIPDSPPLAAPPGRSTEATMLLSHTLLVPHCRRS